MSVPKLRPVRQVRLSADEELEQMRLQEAMRQRWVERVRRELDVETLMLPAYDRERACTVCGFDRCTTTYRPKRVLASPYQMPVREREALVRGCPNCGFTWDERPLELQCYTTDREDL